jgi:hypothetical protein
MSRPEPWPDEPKWPLEAWFSEDEEPKLPRLVFPNQAGWSQFTDYALLVAGFGVSARKRIITQAVQLVQEELRSGPPGWLDDADALWGTFCAAMLLKRMTQGGKRTWGMSRRGKPGLLDLIEDLRRPPCMAQRNTPDCIGLARRRAIAALEGFKVDVPAMWVKGLVERAQLAGRFPATRGSRPVSSVELHNRVTEVLRFYGVAEPVMGTGGKRLWRFYPWRLDWIEYQFTKHGDVRLAGLDWLGPRHFLPWLQANQARLKEA